MLTRTIYVPRHAGRPAVPDPDRGLKAYDPRRRTSKRDQIIIAILDNREALDRGDLLYGDLARQIGTAPSYMSIVKNSPWGQRRMQQLQSIHARLQRGTAQRE